MTEIGYYGDDFTGSVDSLLQLRRAGLDGVLLTRADDVARHRDSDVVGIAGVARSTRPAESAAEVRTSLRALSALSPRVVQYKTSSTADSSPVRGSIGAVADLLASEFGQHTVLACFAQPDFGRFTFFGHHFARDGAQIYRLDRQPTMSRHPVTPMRDSDLRVILGRQSRLPIHSLPWTEYGRPGHVATALQQAEGVIVADALSNAHLDELAEAVLANGETQFVLGAGGLSGALGRASKRSGRIDPPDSRVAASPGPVLVLSGSRSMRTQEQIEASGWITVGAFTPDVVQHARAELTSGRSVVVSSTTDGGRQRASEDVGAALAGAGRELLEGAPIGRLVVCGGDTSGQVLRGLGVTALTIVAQPWGNAPLCNAVGPDAPVRGMAVVLKGGQMGHRDLLRDIEAGRGHQSSDATTDQEGQ